MLVSYGIYFGFDESCYIGAEVSSFSLLPILYKRLRIQGSTLRSRSEEYQADLIKRFTLTVGDSITGENGVGPLRTFIHKVSSHVPSSVFTSC